MLQQRILESPGWRKFGFYCTQSVKEFLLERGTDAKYGARHLKRAIEKNLVFPLSNLVATGRVSWGDFVRIDMDSDGEMTFVKEAEGVNVSVFHERYEIMENMPSAMPRVAARAAGPMLHYRPA